MADIIKIEDLIFEYGGEDGAGAAIRAVDGLCLTVEAGSFVAVVGKNGSGKSTMAKNINALLLPSGGAVYVDGYRTSDEAAVFEIRSRAGMVFQNPDNQIVSAVVEDDVAFGPENLGVAPDEIRKRVDAALRAVEMDAYRKQSPHRLSGGQKQRVAIAGVIAMRPKCIVFDEPTAMLDPKGRDDVMRIIARLRAEGITTLLITHFMEEAADADRVVVMDAGRVALDGTPAEVFERVDELRALGLTVPLAAELGDRLRKRGHPIPPGLTKAEDWVAYLCR